MSRQVLGRIRDTVGSMPPETGGMLGGNRDLDMVTHFHFDRLAARTHATYSPDHELLTRILTEEWNPAGVRLMGFVHSHPRSCRTPSDGDEVYAHRILGAIPAIGRLLLPIVMTPGDSGHFELLPFAVSRNAGKAAVQEIPLVVEDEDVTADTQVSFKESAAFARVRLAYDLVRHQRARVVALGCGGAAEFLEMVARAGVGEFVLIDRDVVSETNLATQQTYRRDIGRMKVEAVAERLRDINPHAIVKPLYLFSDQLADERFGSLLRVRHQQEQPGVTLLCGMTDSFEAQARVNRLALQFGVPSLCAQVYFEGRGAEVTFTHPETTPACHRCVLNSRYRAYLQGGFRNDTTSDGTPIGSTGRLNSLKFFVAMALMHHGTEHPRWGQMLNRIGNRNLIQIRLDPDLNLPVFDRVFGAADKTRIFCDEAVWLPQLPDNPANGYPTCPDCGGTGDLRHAMGTIPDTREMRT
jgi:proteasome lid subunit RPN8/RPN11